MSRIAYVNKAYVPHGQAAVHIEDRGYQFADGVYEVVTVFKGALIDEEPHLDRLDRSLNELEMAWPVARSALKVILRQVVRQNHLINGVVYFQVTRGVASRQFEYPKDIKSSLVVTAKHMRELVHGPDKNGISVVTLPDLRWQRCDIKTTGLLASCMTKQRAKESGFNDAWMIDRDGFITEGTSNNAWIVTHDDELITRDISNALLNGITRRRILKIAESQGLNIIERAFTPQEAKKAREAFISSASSFVKPVTKIDDCVLGNGQIGSLSEALSNGFLDFLENS